MGKYALDPCVEAELWNIWEFIAKDNPQAATDVVESAFETFGELAENPDMGTRRKFKKSRLQGIRSWHVKDFDNYLIFYRCVPNGIEVLHVYHGARDIDKLFGHSRGRNF